MTEQWIGWRKARASANQGGSCVEVARATNGAAMGVRDSKDRGGPVLSFELDSWSRFVDGVASDSIGR